MSAPRCYRVTFWENLPGMPGFLTSSLLHGSAEYPTRDAAELGALGAFGSPAPPAAADISAVYRRSTRRLGRYASAVPGMPAARWYPAEPSN